MKNNSNITEIIYKLEYQNALLKEVNQKLNEAVRKMNIVADRLESLENRLTK